jgi:hypothetical protein
MSQNEEHLPAVPLPLEPAGMSAVATEARKAVSEVLTQLGESAPAGAAAPRLFPHGITDISVDVSIGVASGAPNVALKVHVKGPERAGAAAAGEAEAQQTRTVSFQVRRFTTASLSDARADAILTASTNLLRTMDGTDDVSADVRLSRSGSVGTFTVGNGIITSQADYNQVCAQGSGPRIFVVNQLLFCGGNTPSPGFIFIGCADTPGSCMVMVRTDDDDEPVLWAHEFGHNCGLRHRNVDFAVMHETVATNRRRINAAERNAYEGRASFAATAATGDPMPAQKAVDVREFVLQKYIHGIPLARAREFSPRFVADLLPMLHDPQYERYWANIVSTICMIGDPDAATPVMDFLLRGEGSVSSHEYDAKCMALMNLGRLIRRAEMPAQSSAFGALRAGIDPAGLPVDVRWMNPYGLNEDEQRIQIAKMSAWGLALTGSPMAEETLRGVQRAASVTSSVELTASTQSQHLPELIDEALAFYEAGRE